MQFLSRIVFVCLIVILALPVSGATIGDSFTISTLIGDDSTPPSVPSPVTATPLATSQIDITWGISTDDTVVSGYQLFRDSIQIATTTLTTYSDTGLVASTTYTYTVVAFDIFGNFSSSSAPVSTTTFALPVVPPTPTSTPNQEGTQATKLSPKLTGLTITAGTESVNLAFSVNVPVRFSLRYGEESAFSDGIIEGALYARTHETLVSGLKPATRYEYELFGYDRFGKSVLLSHGTFTTLALPDATAPANVGNFTARAADHDVLLSWDQPQDPDYAYVRIIRNHRFFPIDPNDGFLVYEGRASEFFDRDALRDYDAQYYTIFTYDSSGNRSSGAIARVRRLGAPNQTPSTTDTASSSSGVALTLADIEVVQNGAVRKLTDAFSLLHNSPFVLRVPYDRFPRHLKVITVTLALPNDPNRVFSFLLRANEDFSYYEAALAPLALTGEYGLTFSVFDVKENQIFDLSGSLRVATDTVADTGQGALPGTYVQLRSIYISLFLLLLLILFIILARRRNEDNDAVEK